MCVDGVGVGNSVVGVGVEVESNLSVLGNKNSLAVEDKGPFRIVCFIKKYTADDQMQTG
jgi:hypothetical protein